MCRWPKGRLVHRAAVALYYAQSNKRKLRDDESDEGSEETEEKFDSLCEARTQLASAWWIYHSQAGTQLGRQWLLQELNKFPQPVAHIPDNEVTLMIPRPKTRKVAHDNSRGEVSKS